MNRLIRIADDSELQRAVYRDLLARNHPAWEPCDVETFNDGSSLLQAIAADMSRGIRTPVVILDQNMGGLTGLETAVKLQEMDVGILMVLVTAVGLASLEIPEVLRQRLFVLRKPTEPHVLRSQIGVMIQLWNDKRFMEEQESRLRTDEQSLSQMWEALRNERGQTEKNLAAQQAFLTAVTHEVQTPMNGILGMTYLLSNTELSAVQSQYIKAIEQSSRQLLAVIGDILDYSRSQSGNLALDTGTINLCELLDEILELNMPLAQEKQLDFQIIIPQEIPELWEADGTRLRQMLLNLVGNALKFTHKGQVIVGVELDRPGGNQLRFWVRDTGIGIPEDTKNHLFEAFHQEQSGMNRTFGGMGLGLAITAELTRLMKGHIGFESTVGKGSHFWFQIPLTCLGVSERPKASHKVLLLAVSDRYARQSLSNHLGRLGYYTESTSDLAEFQEVLEGAMGSFSGLVVEDNFFENMLGPEHTDLLKEIPPQSLLLQTGKSNLDLSKIPFEWSTSLPVSYRTLHSLYGTTVDLPLYGKVDRTTLRVLVVEDHPLNRNVALKILHKCGYLPENTKAVPEGPMALSILQEEHFDIILMDCQMPGMDGFECTEAIRAGKAGEQNLSIPIIAVTANTSSQDRKRCTEAGMNAFIPKPIHAERLDETMVRCAMISHSTRK